MTTIDHGMNVDEVDKLGRQLQNDYAAKMRDLMAQIDKLVNGTSQQWSGKDADTFRSWWPNKKQRMAAIAEDLHGYGQSALNNATEQRQASGGSGAPGGTPGSTPGSAPGSTPGGTPSTPTTPTLVASGGAAVAGAATGVLAGSDRSWQDVQAAYDAKYVKEYGLWGDGGPNGENRYQCVSWAWYRMRELGYTGAQVQGHGGVMADHLGGNTSTAPSTGAVMSIKTSGEFGHVVVAEEVVKDANGLLHVRVSEMNTQSDIYVGRPEEYRSDQWFVQNGDGSWNTPYGRLPVTVFNPNYPTTI